MVDLFNELLETVLDYDDGIAMSHTVHIPALRHLREMADNATIDRCLKKLKNEREALRGCFNASR